MAILVTFAEIRAAGALQRSANRASEVGVHPANRASEVGVHPSQTIPGRQVPPPHSDNYPVLTVTRAKGPAFSMGEPQQPWSWRKMLNRFDDDTLERIIGPGVVGIFCQPMGQPEASSYDHKREHFAKKKAWRCTFCGRCSCPRVGFCNPPW